MPWVVVYVVALGGNAIAGPGLRVDYDSMLAAIKSAMRALLPLIVSRDLRLVVTHGNGPHVGLLAEALLRAGDHGLPQPLHVLTAMTQAWIGSMIKHVGEVLTRERGLEARFEVVATRVLVEVGPNTPMKPVGRLYTREEAEALASRLGWVMVEDPRGGWRRGVPSPPPLKVLDVDAVTTLLEGGFHVVACGGGGIPVVEDDGVYRPVEAVVDKDLCSSKLAVALDADLLAILTDVKGVAVNYRKPGERWLRELKVDEARRLLERGEFPPGSMGPKVEAAIQYAEATGRRAVIGSLKEAYRVLRLESGTIIEP